MAERRMFAKSIIDSDIFVTMPISTQALYFHLAMRADDDGFVSNPKSIAKIIGVNEDDLKILAAKKYILAFESGVVVIKHWNINNYIQKDRYKPTTYYEEKAMLTEDSKNAYKFKDSFQCIQNVYKMDTQVSIDKVSIDKNRLDKVSIDNNNITPTYDDIKKYCDEKGYEIDIEDFMHYWTERDWKRYDSKIKKYVPIKDIKGTIRTWAKNEKRYEEDRQVNIGSKKAYIKDVEMKTQQRETAQQRDDRNLKKLEEVGEKMLKEWNDDNTRNYQIDQTNQNVLTDNINT